MKYFNQLTASPKAKKTMKYYFFGYASEYFPSEREEQPILDGEIKRGKNQVALYCQTDYSTTYAYDSRQGGILWVEDTLRNCAYQLAKEFDLEEIPDSYVNSPFTYWRINKADRKKINKRLKQLIDSLEVKEDSSEDDIKNVGDRVQVAFDTESLNQGADSQMTPEREKLLDLESELIEQIQSRIADYAANNDDWIGFLEDASVSQWAKDNDYFVLADLLALNETYRKKFWVKFDVRYPEFST